METIEQMNEAIAVYMGASIREWNPPMRSLYNIYLMPDGKKMSDLKYHERIEWIYPVWLKVRQHFHPLRYRDYNSELYELFKLTEASLITGSIPSLHLTIYKIIKQISNETRNNESI